VNIGYVRYFIKIGITRLIRPGFRFCRAKQSALMGRQSPLLPSSRRGAAVNKGKPKQRLTGPSGSSAALLLRPSCCSAPARQPADNLQFFYNVQYFFYFARVCIRRREMCSADGVRHLKKQGRLRQDGPGYLAS
jgi:hypothetical protein